jgi:SulP family sulfate permease
MMVIEKAGFIERLGRENVCPHIDAALARAREILGLPVAQPTDPNFEEKQKIEVARLELTNALGRVNHVLNAPRGTSQRRSPAPTHDTEKITVQVE